MSDFKLNLRGSPTGPRSYRCDEHGVFELDVELATSADPRPCPTCDAPCERTLDTALYKPQRGALVRGKVEAPRTPLDLDSRKLADGMSPAAFRKEREAKWFAHDMDQAKRKGLG